MFKKKKMWENFKSNFVKTIYLISYKIARFKEDNPISYWIYRHPSLSTIAVTLLLGGSCFMLNIYVENERVYEDLIENFNYYTCIDSSNLTSEEKDNLGLSVIYHKGWDKDKKMVIDDIKLFDKESLEIVNAYYNIEIKYYKNSNNKLIPKYIISKNDIVKRDTNIKRYYEPLERKVYIYNGNELIIASIKFYEENRGDYEEYMKKYDKYGNLILTK